MAQFQRTINPAFRSSSPQPSIFESHHDPKSDLAMRMGHQEEQTPPSRENTLTPQKSMQPPPKIDYRRQAQNQASAPLQHNQLGDPGTVPHNEYPTDGMTMFCRTAPPSERSSAASPMRPSSRDSQSEYSNPTSFSSQEVSSRNQSPTKPKQDPANPFGSPTKQVQKKRSGFFSNSPFRRKSKSEKTGREQGVVPVFAPPTSHNSWSPTTNRNGGTDNTGLTRSYARDNNSTNSRDKYSGSPEPVNPRANFQLNVGPNVFDVASPDSNRNKIIPNSMSAPVKELDPIAQALAELKGINKQSSVRMSADRYHGIATPAPPGTPNISTPSAHRSAHLATHHDTPPPSYQDPTPVKRLDPPQPAFTSKQMHETTRKYIGKTQDMYGSSRPNNRGNLPEATRASSPLPIRSVSPKPGYSSKQSQVRGANPGASSPNPYSGGIRSRQTQSTSPTKPSYSSANTSRNYSQHGSPNEIQRTVSPQPQFARQERPHSSAGTMALQLAEGGSIVSQRGGGAVRPMSNYGGQQPQGNEIGMHDVNGRTRSKSMADGRQYTKDGRPILQFGLSLLPLLCFPHGQLANKSAFNSESHVSLPRCDSGRAKLRKGRRSSSATVAR